MINVKVVIFVLKKVLIMASPNKKWWKLQVFMAHGANVNCLALGRKSGRVLVTGGDDKKVNLWAVGKHSCFMSLGGHNTAIECVQFNHLEEQVCAGSRAGVLKVWDLEAAKLVRTLSGHKNTIKSIDFHPYGDFLASGSCDNSIKIWDSRKKGCIFTYNGHQLAVNSLKFSPDGNWIASGSDDCSVKLWDLRIGKVLKQFDNHAAPVSNVQFHPHEFLLATGGADQCVNIFDLENFNLVSSELDLGTVRSLAFSNDGECLFTGVRDNLKVLGWEPNRILDSVPVNWGRVADLSLAHGQQLIGASFHMLNVQVFVVDLTKVQPFGKAVSDVPVVHSPFTPSATARRSFSKAEQPVSLKTNKTLAKTVEESTSGTDPEEDVSYANITNITDYNEIFKGRHTLTRTPPPESESICFQEPEHDYTDPSQPQKLLMSESFEALSLDNTINNYHNMSPPPIPIRPKTYARSISNLDQVYENKRPPENKPQSFLPNINKSKIYNNITKTPLSRQTSCNNDTTKNNNYPIRQTISDINLTKNNITSSKSNLSSRRGSISKPVPPKTLKTNNLNNAKNGTNSNVTTPIEPKLLFPLNGVTSNPNIYITSSHSPEEPRSTTSSLGDEDFVPISIDKPAGLEVNDFLPKTNQMFGSNHQLPHMSEAEVLGVIMKGYEPMISVIATRQRSLKIVINQYKSKDAKAAIDTALAMDDLAVIVDILGVLVEKYTIWNLDLCVSVLPKVEELLQSKLEKYLLTGCSTLKLILRHFGPVIKANLQAPVGSFGVDIPREERYNKSVKCHEHLKSLKTNIAKKCKAPNNVGATFREVNTLIQTMLD